ncbi:DEAD/DEAH box helicase [Sulfitobacter sp. R18_1]|uniref:DEAD/DEAH box helicase n=1 Tax=Sulfitobacter sp. R18_1 TaxID=2821104 RepID=UPI001ADB0B2C|nr:DEAD/DEAH box helicase [Sulfitobacter sp. R18_1]MBO9427905.1 HNH endonuclease [Sulfitobacter sp. R18_1]
MKTLFRSEEQTEFNDRISSHLANPTGPLLIEATTGVGKTRAYLNAAARSEQKIAICFPTHALIDQLLASSDLTVIQDIYPRVTVAAFRPKSFFDSETEYLENKEQCLRADIMLCTSSSVIFDQRLKGQYNGVTERDAILFDEADMLPDLAALTSEMTITRDELKAFNIKATKPLDIVGALLTKEGLDAETKAKARLALEGLTEEPSWFRKCGVTSRGDLAVYSRLPGRILKKISNRSSTVFMSATLSIGGNFNDFKRAMGIDRISPLSTMISPKKHGTLHYDFYLDDAHNTEGWMNTVVEQAMDAANDGRTLVITPSHRLAQEIGEKIPEAVVRERDETTTEAAERMGNSKILIAAGAWAGLDVPEPFTTIIFPQVPYAAPKALGDEWLENEPDMMVTQSMSSYTDSKNAAIRRLIQGQGRGLRSPDAYCRVVFCDPRIEDLGTKFIPDRFKTGYHEGRKVSSQTTKAERSPHVRREALLHHGTKCQGNCDSTIFHIRQLEVHHLNPLALRGAGETRMEDVAVLCRNCHAYVHKDGNNVVSIEALQSRVKEEINKKAKVLLTF